MCAGRGRFPAADKVLFLPLDEVIQIAWEEHHSRVKRIVKLLVAFFAQKHGIAFFRQVQFGSNQARLNPRLYRDKKLG